MVKTIATNFKNQIFGWIRKLWNFFVQKPATALIVLIIAVLFVQITVMAIWADAYPDWVGFGAYDSESGPRAKTLWDWMELLLVPVTLALGAYFLNKLQSENERAVARDNQRQVMLDSFIDKISQMILDESFETPNDNQIKSVARTRALSLFRNLDGDRKGDALQFLYESGLLFIGKGINLLGADLSNAILNGAGLSQAALSGTNLRSAQLQDAHFVDAELKGVVFINANLSNCDFTGAKLNGADFQHANLLGAKFKDADLSDATLKNAKVKLAALQEAAVLKYAIMPGGSVYYDEKDQLKKRE